MNGKNLCASLFLAGAFVVVGCGGLLAPCPTRNGDTGLIATLTGEVGPGEVVSHVVPYDHRGTQNNVSINWVGQGNSGAARPRVYATSAACVTFQAPPARNDGACASPIGSATGECAQPGPTCSDADFIQTGLIVSLDRGMEYRLHVVGDPLQRTSYTLHAAWYVGINC